MKIADIELPDIIMPNEYIGYLYCAINIINQKKYIGKHKLPKRKKCYENNIKIDFSYIGSGKCLKRAISKYGICNFIYVIFDYASSLRELNEKEIMYIEMYNANKRKDFYNIAKGGEGGDTISNNPNKKDIIQRSVTTLRNNPEKNYEKNKKVSIKLKGRPSHKKGKLGKPHTKEFKMYLSQLNKGKIVSTDTRKKQSQNNKGTKNPSHITKVYRDICFICASLFYIKHNINIEILSKKYKKLYDVLCFKMSCMSI